MSSVCGEYLPNLSILIAFGAGLLCANMIPIVWNWVRRRRVGKDWLAR